MINNFILYNNILFALHKSTVQTEQAMNRIDEVQFVGPGH